MIKLLVFLIRIMQSNVAAIEIRIKNTNILDSNSSHNKLPDLYFISILIFL